ncbi:hypothetical protein BO226_19135 [Rhodococcus sp. 2G]|nr:hypothetical protein BO226_18800 [Rhodococcus sp. 2G]APE11052.1 hypothetical protein BO226_19135 [Rhodococcus sp. 2G]
MGAAWLLIVLAALGILGGVTMGVRDGMAYDPVVGTLVWILVGCGAVWYLLVAKRRSAVAAKTPIPTREDEQNARYLKD